jgi:hypothetical protein
LNVHGVNDVIHIDLQTTEPIVPDPSTFDVEMATENLKRHK